MSASVQWSGLEAFKRDLLNLPAHLADEAADPVEDAIELTAQNLVQSYPLGDTGNLRAGVKATLTRSAFGVTGMVKSTSPHAHLWEFGTENRRTRAGWNRGTGPDHRQGLVPIAERHRRRMYEALMDLLRRAGFEVSGRA